MPNVHNDDTESLAYAVDDDEPDFDVEPEYDSFRATIRIEGAELVDDSTARSQALARMLRQIAQRVEDYGTSGIVKDISGNTVGSWELS
jgi:hypothetical protein